MSLFFSEIVGEFPLDSEYTPPRWAARAHPQAPAVGGAGLLEGLLARLMGRYPLSSRFITQTRRVLPMVSLPER
jgi:hypothetical protein